MRAWCVLLASALIPVACSSTPKPGPGASGGPDAGDGGALAQGDGDSSLLGNTNCVPSPTNFDVPGNQCDDDANGKVDDVPTCDTSLALTGNGAAFARAIGLCQVLTGAEDTRWGVVSAEYLGAYSLGTAVSDVQHGILTAYGDVLVPREGAALGVLSTGWARPYDNAVDPANPQTRAFKGGFAAQTGDPKDDAPPGFPKAAVGCPIDSTVHDFIELKLVLRVPANAQGLSFDFDFHSSEWPEFVCSAYNDSFIAYLSGAGGDPANISFDAQGNPVSVNNGFLDRCTPSTPTGCMVPSGPHVVAKCASGEAELGGTGYGAPREVYCSTPSTPGAATGWLTSSAPVPPGGTITLELMIWDTGDQNYDSTVLLDHFQWVATSTTTGTQRPPK
jgi:hypothetical protein